MGTKGFDGGSHMYAWSYLHGPLQSEFIKSCSFKSRNSIYNMSMTFQLNLLSTNMFCDHCVMWTKRNPLITATPSIS